MEQVTVWVVIFHTFFNAGNYPVLKIDNIATEESCQQLAIQLVENDQKLRKDNGYTTKTRSAAICQSYVRIAK